MLDNGSEEITPGGTKKTVTKLNYDKQGDLGRRLVEYLVVVSAVEWNPDGEKSKKNQDVSFGEWKTEGSTDDEDDEFAGYHFRPTISARYPLHDHHDNPLHENVTFFCHPSGGIYVRTQEFLPKVRPVRVGWHSRDVLEFSSRYLTIACLVLGPLLCCHGRNWAADLRYMFDVVGTLQTQAKERRCQGGLSSKVFGPSVDLPLFASISRILDAVESTNENGNVTAGRALHHQFLCRDSGSATRIV